MANDTTPKVWIGCLACYNEGRLVGDWYDAIDAADVTTQQLHDAGGGPSVNAGGYVGTGWAESPHEELWVMDHENLPIDGECSPVEATRLAELVTALEEDGNPVAAVVAFLANEHTRLDQADDDQLKAFEESYRGRWDSAQEWAREVHQETVQAYLGAITACHLSEAATAALEAIARLYVSVDREAEDLARFCCFTVPAPEGGVYVFEEI